MNFCIGKMKLSLLALLIGGGLSINPAAAQGPPINTETALLSGFNNAFRTYLLEMQKSGDLPGGMTGNLHVDAVPMMFPYAVIPGKLVVGGAIPYLNKELYINGPGGTTHLSERGLGDLRLFGEYAFYIKDEKEKTTRATAIGGVDLPTGSNGNPNLPPGLWNGSGAANYLLGSAFSYIPERWGLYTDLIYRMTTQGSGYQFGNTLRYDLALGYRLFPGIYEIYPSPQVNLLLELNGLWEDQSRDFRANGNGINIPDSGGNTIFISPGIQFIPGRGFLMEASVQLPVVEHLNGLQMRTDYQYILGLRWLVF